MQNPKKNLICAWKSFLNEGNYSLKIDGGRQTETLIEELRSEKNSSTIILLLEWVQIWIQRLLVPPLLGSRTENSSFDFQHTIFLKFGYENKTFFICTLDPIPD